VYRGHVVFVAQAVVISDPCQITVVSLPAMFVDVNSTGSNDPTMPPSGLQRSQSRVSGMMRIKRCEDGAGRSCWSKSGLR
jgi:hypothetical protein